MDKIIDFELENKARKAKERIEEETGRKVSEKGMELLRQKILKADEMEQIRSNRIEQRRKNLKKAGIGAIALGGVVVGVAGNVMKDYSIEENSNEPPVKQETEVSDETPKDMVEENTIVQEIVEQYNAKYPEMPIQEEDVGILEYRPNYLIKQTNEDKSITYIYDAKMTESGLKENQETVYSKENNFLEKDGYDTEGIYTVVNKKDNTILTTVANLDNYIVEIEALSVFAPDNQEYTKSDKQIHFNLDGVDGANIYIDLKDKVNKILEARNNEQKEEKGYEIGD